MEEFTVEIDPLFTGMTRPPLAMGVPMEWFGLNFMLFGIGMILFTALSSKILYLLFVILPLHAVARIATEKDPHWMRVHLTRLHKCPPVQNKRFWKCNSYKP